MSFIKKMLTPRFYLANLSFGRGFSKIFRRAKSAHYYLLFLCLVTSPLQAIVLDFDLSLNTSVDSGLDYTDYDRAGAGNGSNNVVGFQIDITSIDGVSVDLDPVAAFCSEITESIGTGTHTFDIATLSTLAAGTATNAGTASSSIPSGGIGALRAARLAYLFDSYYISEELTGWMQTDATPNLHAFQLAVWEITHDSNMDLYTGDMALNAQTGGENELRRTNARLLANDWVEAVDTANVDVNYESTKFEFWALTNNGEQDVILALEKNSVNEQEFSNAVPEPSSYALLFGLNALAIVVIRRRRSVVV